jgi:hypothetical protein
MNKEKENDTDGIIEVRARKRKNLLSLEIFSPLDY